MPVHDLAVCLVGVFCAERRPPDQTFEHDRSNGPPIAEIGVALCSEDLGSNVVRSADSRVRHDASRFAPSIDLAAIAHGKVDLVEVDRVSHGVSISTTRSILHQLLVVRVLMLLLETSGQAEIGQLDVPTTVKQDVVRLDVTKTMLGVILTGLGNLPMNVVQLVNSLNRHGDLGHIEACDIL